MTGSGDSGVLVLGVLLVVRVVVGEFAEGVFDELLAVVLEIDISELGIGKRNGLEEGLRDACHGDGVLGIDGAIGDTGKEACERLGEAGDGNEALGDGRVEAGGEFSGGLKREQSAVMIEAIFGFAVGTEHAATTGIGVGKGTARQRAAGSLLGHRKSPERWVVKRKRPAG